MLHFPTAIFLPEQQDQSAAYRLQGVDALQPVSFLQRIGRKTLWSAAPV
jgi:hypothetical protein